MTGKLTALARCAGCGAKVGAGVLRALLADMPGFSDPALLVGFDTSDDASVYRVSEDLALVSTLDFFPPVADDPYLFGRIAATNALSDVYAMGGEPKLAQNILIVPRDLPGETVREILRGGADTVREAGALLTGGHSIHGLEPVYGLAVTGFVHPDRLFANVGAQTGDALFLTKALGVGVLLTAAKADLLPQSGQDALFAQMTALNRAACEVARAFPIRACTDVTGFGLVGHALEMATPGIRLVFEADRLPLLPQALDFARMGLVPEGAYKNRAFAAGRVTCAALPLELEDLLYDPQTSGGLLIAVPECRADAFEAALGAALPVARRVGWVEPGPGDLAIR